MSDSKISDFTPVYRGAITRNESGNRPDQLRSHLNIARQNGVTDTELVETITHMAFYSGWPSAVSAFAIAKEVFQK